MLVKSLAVLASFSLVSISSAWEIFMYETTAGGDPENCNGGGTTVSGTGSVCQLAAPNTVAMQVINDPEGCEFEVFTGTGCSGSLVGQNGFCFNIGDPVSVRVLC
ncbi:hypothetical protein J3R30DRAFT_3510129 [Lentinula aciculospora]|uniref:Uncharacterized protein n=1 Tax=Lentinula aciculospora TaxID=153920 RepID=A0A9W9A4Z1_9AGAR|nr:hypothetical protein J3R30DRAFT_3510129 [Lentinula aciculospora]